MSDSQLIGSGDDVVKQQVSRPNRKERREPRIHSMSKPPILYASVEAGSVRVLASVPKGKGMGKARVSSCLMRVSSLDRSVTFYRDVFQCRIAIHEPDAALLLTPDGFEIYLRTHEESRIGGITDIGVEQIIWSADSEEELYRIEQRMRIHYPSTYSNTLGGISFVDGVDPDGIRVLTTYPTPQQLPREVIDRRFR